MQCNNVNPNTGSQCTMGKGHAGPHKVGDPYDPEEVWVVKCGSGNGSIIPHRDGCVYHDAWYKDHKKVPVFLSCIRCGHEKPKPKPSECRHENKVSYSCGGWYCADCDLILA